MLDLFIEENEMTKEMISDIDSIKEMAENHIVPFSYPDILVNNWCNSANRWSLNKYLGFSLISLDWVIPLSKWIGNRKCLEVMAGNGMFSYALQQQGIDVHPTDDFSWSNKSSWNENKNYWTLIENNDAVNAVMQYGKNADIILMSWPYMDDVAYKVLKAMRKVNKNCLMIYIGEEEYGCTANDEFFEKANYVDDNGFYKSVENFKSWSGIHDRPILIN